jgi:arabinoxylan arabinofuranohydrolase
VIGSLAVANTGGWYAWKTENAPVSGTSGVHDLYFVFKGATTGQLLNFDYWQFNRKTLSGSFALGSNL